jgi:hypothetical protein
MEGFDARHVMAVRIAQEWTDEPRTARPAGPVTSPSKPADERHAEGSPPPPEPAGDSAQA